ncbi:MAG TPA: crosslink repair DNA glycosylase YcaQ family protein, partial [Caulobacteraceae bacterium]
DSVNVLVRSHYLPVFSRRGAYDMAALDKAAYGRGRTLFEYWGHEASLIPVSTYPLLRWRMARAESGEGIYTGLARFGRERAAFVADVLAEVAERGPISAGELSGGHKSKGSWWGWSDGKRALEFLFWAGRVTTHSRRGFERLYDLTERVLPREMVEATAPSAAEAHRALLKIAARAQGVATERDLRDYWRLGVAETRDAVQALVEEGVLRPAAVKGWREAAYLHHQARRPRKVQAAALLSPFDSLVWFRPRAERLFDFRYRLEIYTPQEKRVHGYYVLPFLLDERLAARVDLKADRKGGALQVKGVTLEQGADAGVWELLAGELRRMVGWLGLDDLAPGADLPPEFRAVLAKA